MSIEVPDLLLLVFKIVWVLMVGAFCMIMNFSINKTVKYEIFMIVVVIFLFGFAIGAFPLRGIK